MATALSFGLAAVGVAGGAGPPPLRMVVIGDSFTAALDPDLGRDDPQLSWATGTRLGSPSIQQHLSNDGWDVRSSNVAVSGNRMMDVAAQLERAPDRADLVLVWMGTNDLCTPGAKASQFFADIDAAFDAIDEQYPDAKVLVFAPPMLSYIGRQHQAVPEAARFWDGTPYCTHFFGDTRSSSAGTDRQQRFDAALERSASEHGFYHSTSLQKINRPLSAWATWDYFHPSREGSGMFAERAWPDVHHVVGSPLA